MLISVLAIAFMGVVGMTARWLSRDWLHPAALFALMWIVACGLPIIVAPEYITSGSGAMWILLNVSLVAAGAILGSMFARHTWRRRSQQMLTGASGHLLSNKILRIAVVACLGFSGLYIVLWFRRQGFNVGQVGSLGDAARLAHTMSVQRYSAAGQGSTLLIQVLLSVSLLCPLLGGTLFVQRRKLLDTALALGTIIPAFVNFLLQSTRSSVLYAAIMWMAGYMSTRVYCGMRAKQLGARTLGIGVLTVFALFLLTSIGHTLRGGSAPTLARLNIGILSDSTLITMFGHIGALSTWLDSTDLLSIEPAAGRYTFAGLFDTVSPGSRLSGIYGEGTWVGPTGGSTNIYTIFRGLIEDYTLVGSLAVILFVSFCAGIAYDRVQQQRPGWIGMLTGFYLLTLWYVVSLFNYNSVLLALTMYSLIWLLPQRRRRTPAWGC